MEMGE